MVLTPIYEIKADPARLQRYNAAWENLKRLYGHGSDDHIDANLIFDEFTKEALGEDGYKFTGRLKPDAPLDALQISMVCAGGFNLCGGCAYLYDDERFTCRIYPN